MEKENDEYIHLEKEIETSDQGNKETESKEQGKDQVLSYQNVGTAQSENQGKDIGIKKKIKIQAKDIIFFIIVLACLVGVIYFIHIVKDETTLCVKNPFIYGASKMGNVDCSCSQGASFCPALFSFNDSSIHFKSTKCNVGMQKGNMTIPKLEFVTP